MPGMIHHAAALLKACSDPTRFRILNLLRRGELCVCDLMDVLALPQSKVSRHLAYLKRVALVQGRKEGLWMHYCLSSEGLRFTSRVIEACSGSRAGIPEFDHDLKTLRQKKKKLVGCLK